MCEDIRVLDSDAHVQKLFDLVVIAVNELEKRHLIFQVGLPRRKTLLLHKDENVSNDFIAEVCFVLALSSGPCSTSTASAHEHA